jgi:hypothetical protein
VAKILRGNVQAEGLREASDTEYPHDLAERNMNRFGGEHI